MARSLKDMVVVITGASSGIGRALAEALHTRGTKLALTARRLDRLQELNESLGGGHLVIAADVSKQEDCQKLIDESLGHFGRIDTLVCNAGYGIYVPVHETTPDAMRQIFATNVFGCTDCIAAATPYLLRQEIRDGYRAQVILVSSFVARRAVPYMGAYSATKAAQLMLAEAMRVELADRQIAVTSVHPIMTKTEFGQTAESGGPVKMPRDGSDLFRSKLADVVGRIVGAIESPVPEVWPRRISRWIASFATFAPRFADWQMSKYLAKIREGLKQNETADERR
jgi:short-subunit dehydrogenase